MSDSMQDMMKEVERMLGGKVKLADPVEEHNAISVGPGSGWNPDDIRETTPAEKADSAAKKTRGNGYEGRGPTGRLRNFKQMDDDKLIRTYEQIQWGCRTGKEDYEALSAYEGELRYRTWLAGRWTPSES